MNIRGVEIVDTYAEAFTMRAARVIITGRTLRWARDAALAMTGFATSVIGCRCEAGIERELADDETPDGRPGISVLVMTMPREDLRKRLIERIGQTVLTCPTTACFDGLPHAPDRLDVGAALRRFGDGFQGSKVVAGTRFWRIPVMEGEFLIQEDFGVQSAIGGGNFLVLGRTADATLEAAEAAAAAMASREGVILPFPGGIARSGSKVGARQSKTMIASTNETYCPTLRAVTESALPEGVNSALELVIDGLDADVIRAALRDGIEAACREGVVAIAAGNYAGKLGSHRFHLHAIMAADG